MEMNVIIKIAGESEVKFKIYSNHTDNDDGRFDTRILIQDSRFTF